MALQPGISMPGAATGLAALSLTPLPADGTIPAFRPGASGAPPTWFGDTPWLQKIDPTTPMARS